ncbi:uncharacterized protein LOC113323977 [Papaver somniferum]|uniref:uncharacterized protein LOC113323977 n=1 Tax=Papaver somniferum TaxID=3469 RepID=UPI000E701DB4|nr:uncharacterized protein LOC113323977 [Papaver somniferum]
MGSSGNSGGLLSIWNKNKVVKENERMGINNITTVFTSKLKGDKWAVCNLYSPCGYNERADFWNELKVRNWWKGPICFAGDMNDVRNDEERNKGEADSRNNSFLNNFIMSQELIGLALVGGAFTWSDMQKDPLLCRLGKFLLSVEMDVLIPHSIQIALTSVIYDHRPIMLVTKPNFMCKPNFKFENGWLLHKDFFKKVKEWWDVMEYQGQASFVFFKKLQYLKYFLKNWSRVEFGSVKRVKVDLTEKIELLDQMEETHVLTDKKFEDRMHFLLNLKNLKATEARKWPIRDNQNDFRWGDPNTSYFHRLENAKRKRNTIAKLDIEEVECFDQESIKVEMKNHF